MILGAIKVIEEQRIEPRLMLVQVSVCNNRKTSKAQVKLII